MTFDMHTDPLDVPPEATVFSEGGASPLGHYVNQFQKVIHANAIAHGFWSTPGQRDPLIKGMLIVCEVAEAMEAIRNKTGYSPCTKEGLASITQLEEEAADILIRLLDFSEAFGVDLIGAALKKHEYNRKRPCKHGKTC